MVVKRFEVYLINLDPTIGSEIQKTRPCLVISPDEMNRFIRTVIVAPMTTKGTSYPTRVRANQNSIDFARKSKPCSKTVRPKSLALIATEPPKPICTTGSKETLSSEKT